MAFYPMVGMQAYPWVQRSEALGRDFAEYRDEAMAATAACGIEAWEDMLPETSEWASHLRGLLERHNLKSPSIYVNARLHEEDWPQQADRLVTRAGLMRDAGLKVLVVNPEPISWRGNEDKSDAHLRTQAEAMQTLGSALGDVGVTLAYHTHDREMRHAAREFHHTLLGTSPEAVGLCLDAHWIYRGAGNSEVALYDIIHLYGDRVVSLHLRQSSGGVWTEALGDGDIDYRPLARRLTAEGFTGPIVIEQAREAGTPDTMPSEEALRRGCAWVREVFGQ